MSTAAERRRRWDAGVIIALAWLFAAIAMTVLVGPKLGLRGWLWMGAHHIVCVIGVSHEMWRGWKRRKKRLAQESG